MAYNYLEELKSDVRNYIKEVASDYMDCEDMDELRDSLYDNLWDEDSVTGNGSGSYTCNREKAKEKPHPTSRPHPSLLKWEGEPHNHLKLSKKELPPLGESMGRGLQ